MGRGRPPKPLAEKIRRELDRAGLTNFEVAKQIGVQPSSVGRFKRGETDLKLEHADRLMRLLGFTVISPEDRAKGRAKRKGDDGDR